MLGDLVALLVPLSVATALTLSRFLRPATAGPYSPPLRVALPVSAWPAATPLAPAGLDILWIGLIVLLVSPVSFAMIATGPRYIPSAEVSLLLLLETVLGPLWVWLGVAEVPTTQAFVGGAVLLATLTAHSLASLRREQRSPAVRWRPSGHSG